MPRHNRRLSTAAIRGSFRTTGPTLIPACIRRRLDQRGGREQSALNMPLSGGARGVQPHAMVFEANYGIEIMLLCAAPGSQSKSRSRERPFDESVSDRSYWALPPTSTCLDIQDQQMAAVALAQRGPANETIHTTEVGEHRSSQAGAHGRLAFLGRLGDATGQSARPSVERPTSGSSTGFRYEYRLAVGVCTPASARANMDFGWKLTPRSVDL
jgi:hypothetical protein